MPFSFRHPILAASFTIAFLPSQMSWASTAERLDAYHQNGDQSLASNGGNADDKQTNKANDRTAGITKSTSSDTTVMAQVQSLDRVQAEQLRYQKLNEGQPAVYQDKYMDATTLPSSSDEDSLLNADVTGYRSYLIEGRIGYSNYSGTGINTRSSSDMGLRTEYRFDTLNYGEFMMQADVRTRQGDQDLNSSSSYGVADQKSNSRLTLRNLGFPITTSTFADTSVGDISSETTDALSRNYRFSLGNNIVRGASTHIFNRESDFRAGFGQRGNLVGGPYPGFESTQGNAAWLGYTQRFSSKLYAGIQVNQLQDVPVYGGLNIPVAAGSATNNANVTTLALSAGYGYELIKDDDYKIRATVLGSRTSAQLAGLSSSATGLYLEGGYKAGRYRHEIGAYTTAPNLNFGQYVNPVDTRGAYWRIDRSDARLNWGMGADYEQQNNQRLANQATSQRANINFNAQQQLSRDSSIGGNANIGFIRYNHDIYLGNINSPNFSNSYYGSLFYQTRFSDWGRSRFTATSRHNQTLVSNGVAATGQEIAWEHDWITGKYETMRPEFTTTLGYARDQSEGETQLYPTAGLVFRHWLDADWNVGGNLNYSSRRGNLSTSQGLSGSLSTERSLGAGWRLGATVNLNQAVVNPTSSALNSPSVSRSNDKSAFVFLRYEGSSGNSAAMLGARASGSAGGGSITGIVFFDANRDNTQQANELGVPNVEVFLDGRYRVNTDKDGRFEFPIVNTGQHQLTMRLESVPLPWGSQDNSFLVDVPLRGKVTVVMPVVKVGE